MRKKIVELNGIEDLKKLIDLGIIPEELLEDILEDFMPKEFVAFVPPSLVRNLAKIEKERDNYIEDLKLKMETLELDFKSKNKEFEKRLRDVWDAIYDSVDIDAEEVDIAHARYTIKRDENALYRVKQEKNAILKEFGKWKKKNRH